MQSNNQVKLITIPAISRSRLCPVSAENSGNWVPLTDSGVRRHFSLIHDRMNSAHSGYNLHTSRRSGATFAFNNNVTLQNIQRHAHVGLCMDCVWRYITDSTNAGEQVAEMFKNKLSSIRYGTLPYTVGVWLISLQIF